MEEDSTPNRSSQSFKNKQLNRLSGVFRPMSKSRPTSVGSSGLFRKPSFTGHFSGRVSSSSSSSSSGVSSGSSGVSSGGSGGISGLSSGGSSSMWSSLRESTKKRQAPSPPDHPGGSPSRRAGNRSSGYRPVLRVVKTKPRLKGLVRLSNHYSDYPKTNKVVSFSPPALFIHSLYWKIICCNKTLQQSKDLYIQYIQWLHNCIVKTCIQKFNEFNKIDKKQKIKVRNEEELFNIFHFKLITNIKQISNYKIKREKEKWK